mmetsp:Transcript_100103/g.268893  ORF Transcript_100103/g.268893 Transcript_100103/m.268893 type:complete len:209 (+) Transcript_100103:693-1319(+)
MAPSTEPRPRWRPSSRPCTKTASVRSPTLSSTTVAGTSRIARAAGTSSHQAWRTDPVSPGSWIGAVGPSHWATPTPTALASTLPASTTESSMRHQTSTTQTRRCSSPSQSGCVGCSCRWASTAGVSTSSRATPRSTWASTARRARPLGPSGSCGAICNTTTMALPLTKTGTDKMSPTGSMPPTSSLRPSTLRRKVSSRRPARIASIGA